MLGNLLNKAPTLLFLSQWVGGQPQLTGLQEARHTVGSALVGTQQIQA